jgi:hypothetical protein
MTKKAKRNLIISATVVLVYFIVTTVLYNINSLIGPGFYMFVIAVIYGVIMGATMMFVLIEMSSAYNSILYLTSWFSNIAITCIVVPYFIELGCKLEGEAGILYPCLIPAIVVVPQSLLFFVLKRKFKNEYSKSS